MVQTGVPDMGRREVIPENPIPAIRFTEGERQMYLTVPTVDAATHLAAPITAKESPDAIYDPLAEPESEEEGRVGRNRPQSAAHVRAITNYLITEPKWVFAPLVAVARPGTIAFTEIMGIGNASIGYIEAGRFDDIFEVTDGAHRVDGMGRAMDPKKNKRWKQLAKSRVGVMIVEETDPAQAGRDFAALASTRAISTSLRDALDTTSPVNTFFMDIVRACRLFAGGERTEFLSNSVGPNSEKLWPFYTTKFIGSQFIVGRSYRSPKSQDAAVNRIISADGAMRALWSERVRHVFDFAAGVIPGWREVTKGTLSTADARREFITISSVGATALMLALHPYAERGEGAVEEAVRSLAGLDWGRTASSVLFGTVLHADPADPRKIATSIARAGFEAGADELLKRLGYVPPASD